MTTEKNISPPFFKQKHTVALSQDSNYIIRPTKHVGIYNYLYKNNVKVNIHGKEEVLPDPGYRGENLFGNKNK